MEDKVGERVKQEFEMIWMNRNGEEEGRDRERERWIVRWSEWKGKKE